MMLVQFHPDNREGFGSPQHNPSTRNVTAKYVHAPLPLSTGGSCDIIAWSSGSSPTWLRSIPVLGLVLFGLSSISLVVSFLLVPWKFGSSSILRKRSVCGSSWVGGNIWSGIWFRLVSRLDLNLPVQTPPDAIAWALKDSRRCDIFLDSSHEMLYFGVSKAWYKVNGWKGIFWRRIDDRKAAGE